ncbi:hypothetical protein [Croceitalea rosinachiae]|uniref:ABC transporter permease n=1 Tax=Croceitalea rosinachiae TaxID=3075596 RepID=A0ABU3A6J0_9FLAO|nr:hypothetical protein [Croceitalea sp. F388]MDT0605508.1 hypothetical protein [Croceitalea sp. F388]
MNNEYSIQRVLNHIKRDLYLLKGTLLTGMLVAIGTLFLLLLLNMIWDKELSTGEFSGIFGFIYFILGIVLTFSIFKEIHNRNTNQLYLTLPISPLERLTAIWLTTMVFYTVAFSILGFVIGEFAIVFGSLFLGADYTPLVPFSQNYWGIVKAYFFIQPLFMLGAISFKKNRVGKTILCLILVAIVFAIFNMMLYGVLNYDYAVFNNEPLGTEAMEKAKNEFSLGGKWLLMMILGPITLLVTYLKLVEKEVS